MRKIYFVYECDGHRTYDTIAVKGVFLDAEKAIAEYNRLKPGWQDSDWLLCMGYLYESQEADPDTSLLHELEELLSTEDEEDDD
jgi:hypothetical protein